jgi:hypothetical protein
VESRTVPLRLAVVYWADKVAASRKRVSNKRFIDGTSLVETILPPRRARVKSRVEYNADVEKVARVFGSHDEADEADRRYFESLTPQQRLDIFLELLWRGRSGDDAAQRLERVYRVVELSQS